MKMDMNNQENLREEVLNDTEAVNNAPEMDEKPPVEAPQRALDDARRIKVMSPGMLVFKRFMRSKLAIAGSFILIFMFAFAFLGGIVSPYRQEEVFYKYGSLITEYGMASVRTEFSPITINSNVDVHYKVLAMTNSYIGSFEEGQTEMAVFDDKGEEYLFEKLGTSSYLMNKVDYLSVGKYNPLLGSNITVTEYNNVSFKTAVETNISKSSFQYNGEIFIFKRSGKEYNILKRLPLKEAYIATDLVFDMYIENTSVTSLFRIQVLKNMYSEGSFTYEGVDYTVEQSEETELFTIYKTEGGKSVPYANLSRFVVRRYNGEDSLPLDFKFAVQKFIAQMEEKGQEQAEFSYLVYDETLIQDDITDPEEENNESEEQAPVVVSESKFLIERKLDSYVIKNEQVKYLIDIYGKPTVSHWLGTDGNGMDVLTRMMYGGRISLLIGFIVIILETLIGVVLGGIAGYFGKWVDQIIMRIVDIFNCIPFMPVLIIIGSVFDKLLMDPYERLMYLMVILGVLGWPGVARLVRGQILSLREQEFMIAAEATGISAGRRIFRHLVPNVMPQLIVTATMGLGSIIITESTLSFLGLGAKYPLATWGAMINSVSDASSLVNYTYIWIPVGLLICLTVIAFNFVGDGLRDAFDPKMKR